MCRKRGGGGGETRYAEMETRCLFSSSPRPRPAAGGGPSAAPGGPPEVSGFVLAAANGRQAAAQLEAATLALLCWLKAELRNHVSGAHKANV